MIVEYTLTADDFVAFTLYHSEHSPIVRKNMRWMRYAVPALYVVLALAPLAGGSSLSTFGMVIIGLAIVWVAGMPSYFQWSVRRNAARHYQRGLVNGQLGPHRMELTETGIRDSTPVSDWHMSWAGIERVAEGPEHLFIYTGAYSAHVVPKHSLGDRVSFFREIVEHKSSREAPTLELAR